MNAECEAKTTPTPDRFMSACARPHVCMYVMDGDDEQQQEERRIIT